MAKTSARASPFLEGGCRAVNVIASGVLHAMSANDPESAIAKLGFLEAVFGIFEHQNGGRKRIPVEADPEILKTGRGFGVSAGHPVRLFRVEKHISHFGLVLSSGLFLKKTLRLWPAQGGGAAPQDVSIRASLFPPFSTGPWKRGRQRRQSGDVQAMVAAGASSICHPVPHAMARATDVQLGFTF
jgi:hypothetical protein